MHKIIALQILVMLLIISGNGYAQIKIGYVSVEEIFAQMPETKKADTALAEYQKALADSYAEQQNDLNDAYIKFAKDSARMTPSVKEFKRTELQNRISDLQNKEQQLNTALEQQKEKVVKPIREKLIKAIKEVSKENGYQHVLYKESAIVFPASDDITQLVKTKLGIK
jgi:outer membrane protein